MYAVGGSICVATLLLESRESGMEAAFDRRLMFSLLRQCVFLPREMRIEEEEDEEEKATTMAGRSIMSSP